MIWLLLGGGLLRRLVDSLCLQAANPRYDQTVLLYYCLILLEQVLVPGLCLLEMF